MKEIIRQLKENRRQFKDIDRFSDQPGIYALFFYGDQFPLQGISLGSDVIIYIGKSESSQLSRDKKTHFATGKTGSSTLRKSLGSMLQIMLRLNPVPRSTSDIEAGRTSHFKFDQKSEERLNEWMIENLGLAYYEFKGTRTELDTLETDLIKLCCPILNIDYKNPENPFSDAIRMARKEASTVAYHGVKLKKPDTRTQVTQHSGIVQGSTSSQGKYSDIWEIYTGDIINAINQEKSLDLNIGAKQFEAVGNRKSYAFRLVLNDGAVENNIGGSAVARDLDSALRRHPRFEIIFQGREVVIRLDKQFNLMVR